MPAVKEVFNLLVSSSGLSVYVGGFACPCRVSEQVLHLSCTPVYPKQEFLVNARPRGLHPSVQLKAPSAANICDVR